MKRYLYLLMVILPFGVFLQKQGSTEELTSPSLLLSVDKNTVHPGEKVTISAEILGWDEKKMLVPVSEVISGIRLINFANYDSFDKTPPYEWEITYPNDYAGISTYKAIVFVEDVIGSNEIKVSVVPKTGNIKSLIFEPGELFVLRMGGSERFSNIALLNNGQKVNITGKELGTVYSENIVDGLKVTPGDSPVISISPDGLVTALQPGEAEIVATNNGKTAVRRIEVVPDDSFSDSDGDMIPDEYDNCLNDANLYQKDADKDGIGDACDTSAGPDISITPSAPVGGKDEVIVAVSDTWSYDCVPNAVSHSIDSDQINITLEPPFSVSDICTRASTKWNVDVNLGALPVAEYTVNINRIIDGSHVLLGSGLLSVSSSSEEKDGDSDGINDDTDNCPSVANPAQKDTDNDGNGDACECGDFSGDGIVNTGDARLIQRCVTGKIPCAPLCDVTGDKQCSTADARLIQRFAVGKLGKEALKCEARP